MGDPVLPTEGVPALCTHVWTVPASGGLLLVLLRPQHFVHTSATTLNMCSVSPVQTFASRLDL